MIRKAIKVLRKYKVPEPYYVEVENPIEKGDPLEDLLTRDVNNDEELISQFGGVRFLVK